KDIVRDVRGAPTKNFLVGRYRTRSLGCRWKASDVPRADNARGNGWQFEVRRPLRASVRQCVNAYTAKLTPSRIARFAASCGYRGSSARCQPSAISLL